MSSNFIKQIIIEDLKAKKTQEIVTRFPPEPNGYLHIGHAKSFCLNFSLAQEFSGRCHLRLDDTNPGAEDVEFVEGIKEDIQWMGFDWGEHLYYASDHFQQLYDWAVYLIKKGNAYVCNLQAEQMREYRGTLTEPGKASPNRDLSVEENLQLFEKMKMGEFAEGQYTLRAKIDLNSGNINLRDPVLYRIRHVTHQRTGDTWKIYPMYDFTHGQSDALEHITHSLCSLEFQDHRPLYDWFLQNLPVPSKPRQIEFARLNLDYTMMSKRKLLELVREKHVSGWDDPRMPTLQGMRRRGYPAAAIRNFCDRIGVTKKNTVIALSTLEHAVREEMDEQCQRAMVVIDPIKVTLTDYPKDKTEVLEGSRHPKKKDLGKRKIPFSGSFFIEQEDFMENPIEGFHRLVPGGEVRMRYAYVIKCSEVIKDSAGKVVELKCTHSPETLGGKKPADKRKVKGIIHWVPAKESLPCVVRLYDRLFTAVDPLGDKEQDYRQLLNAQSLQVAEQARMEPSLAQAQPEQAFQFERQGFFCADRMEHTGETPVFNRTVTLKDNWAKKD